MKYKILKSSFLGKPIHKDKTYIIIGAGISGLLLAYYLKKSNIPFKIIEITPKSGGILGSTKHEYGISEQAANGFLWCSELQEVCDDLGISIQSPKSDSKARYLVRDKKLKKLPLSIGESIGAFGNIILPHRQTCETIQEFGKTYLGTAMTNQILEPAFAGIYGADIAKLSFPGALTAAAKLLNNSTHIPLAVLKNKLNSEAKNVKKKASGTHGFKDGMATLVNGLTEYLRENIEYEKNGLELMNSDEQLIITTPAYVAANFFQGEIKELLEQVDYTAIITTTLFFKKTDLKEFKEGFGCLIPRSEGLTILGVLFNSCIFDHRVIDEQYISLTCILRDETVDREIFQLMDVDIKNMIVKELDILFDIRDNPLDYVIYRWPKGIPLYSPTLYKSWFKLDELLKENYPNRNLFCNYTGEISIRGICQMAKKAVAEK